MNTSSLMTVLSRFAWFLSFSLWLFFAYLISDVYSYTYMTGTENFFSWGWIWAIVFTLITKKVFLSDSFLSSNIADLNQKGIIHEIWSSLIEDVTSDIQGIRTSNQSLTDENTPESIYTPIESEEIKTTPPVYIPPEPDKPNWIVTFFSDRPLAKIGWIILFLAAFFFLSLVWTNVGAIGKVIIWLVFGFSLYGIWVWMDKKGHIAESRTLLWVGIAINTLTLLSGRWIIGDGVTGTLFSDTITLIFLVLNTLFAVVTWLVYNSRTFLVFSFVFAYLIPFLVRSETDSDILMILYVATISLGGYLLVWLFSQRNEREDDMKWLFRTLIIGSLILLALTGFGIDTKWELILITLTSLILTSVWIYISRKTETRDESLPSLLISAYIILTCSLFGIGDGDQTTILIAFLAMIPLMIYTGIFMIGASIMIYSWILLIPLLLGLILLGIFGSWSLVMILLPIVFLYWLSWLFLVWVMAGFFQYIFFIAISLFLFISTITIDLRIVDFSGTERLIATLSAIIFFLLSLWSSYRYKLIYLSLVTLISSSFILVSSLTPEWGGSWLFYGIFLLITFLYPFFISKSFQEQFRSSIAYQVVANLFMIGELFYLGRGTWFTSESSSLITLWIIVFVLSLASLLYSFVLMRSHWIWVWWISTLKEQEKVNMVSLLGIPLSLFTLAIAVTFSESPLVVSTAWILESCVLAYYSSRQDNRLILTGSLILLIIGILRLIPFFDSVHSGQFLDLVPVTIIALGLYFSLTFIQNREDEPLGHVYDIFHIFGISMVGYAVMDIVPHTTTGWSLLGLNLFLLLSLWFYVKISSKIISLWMMFLVVIIFIYHLMRMDTLDMTFGPVSVQLLSLSIGTYGVWYLKENHREGKYAFIYAFIMFLLITSLYVNEISDNIFVVTIYLTIIATVYLLYWINENREKFRTIWLYIGTGVLIKILFFDIWAWMDNLIIRVVALMITWWVMIALSQLYGRRVNRSWSDEFAFSNFITPTREHESSKSTYWKTEESSSSHDDMPFDETIANDLAHFDISHIYSVELQDTQGASILTSRRVGIIRVANYIALHLGKIEFEPWELQNVLESILPHIQSTLPKKELESMLEKIRVWISVWGKIVIKIKNTI